MNLRKATSTNSHVGSVYRRVPQMRMPYAKVLDKFAFAVHPGFTVAVESKTDAAFGSRRSTLFLFN